MTIRLKFKSLLTVALLSSFSSFGTATAEDNPTTNDKSAPVATAEEAAIGFWDIPHLEKAYIDTAPAAREDAIPVGKLDLDDGSKAMVVQLAEDLADDEKHGSYDSFLIAHQGKLVFESYFRLGRINMAHPQSSAVKAYTSLAIGRAIQLGYLTMADLHKPLVSFLQDLDPTKFVEGAEMITLHKAMTMRSGIRLSDEQREEFEETPDQLLGQGEIQTWLEHSAPITTESQSFSYSFDPDLVMPVIDAVVPGTAEEFIKEEILDKLDITNYRWRNNVTGLPEAGWRVRMTSRDMLKLGTLVLNNGEWNDEQLISANYLAKATSDLVDPTPEWIPEAYRYGYYWYQTSIAVGDKSYDATFAWGGGGQHVYVVDELDLIIVITGHDMEDQSMAQIVDVVIPAFAE